jgi:ubiquitin C-terminal hydrolase
MFRGYGQHDTQEFCRVLLEDMNRELNEVKHPAPYKELNTLNKSKKQCDKEFDELFRSRENSLVMDVFYGQIINIFKCRCGLETYSFQKILDIPLLLYNKKGSSDIDELLNEYFEEDEEIQFETKCEKCGKKEKHSKEIKISQPPNVLILSIQRTNGRGGRKSNIPISFPENLDISKYIDHDCCSKDFAKYSLYGIGNHNGSMDFGHYYAYIKINNGSWYEYNDSSVSPMSSLNKSSSSAYVLFYKRNKI